MCLRNIARKPSPLEAVGVYPSVHPSLDCVSDGDEVLALNQLSIHTVNDNHSRHE